MKKLFSLLFVALLTMSAWAETTVTFTAGTDLGATTGNNSPDAITKDGVTISCTDAAFATAEYRFYSGSTTTISSENGNITAIEFTCTANGTTKYGPGCWGTQTGTYSYEGKIGNWAGNAAEIAFVSTAQVRCTKIVVTIGGEAPVETLAAPVFNPGDGYQFDVTSLAVTVSCPTENADIWVYEVVDGEVDYTTQQYFHESGEFYVTKTSTYAAYATKGNDYTDFVYATFTKVLPTCATPTFTPASGATFEDDITVRIDCETEGATILYTVNDDINEAEAPVLITLDETATITAVASLDGYNNSQEASATYTKVEPYNVGGTATFVALTDTIEGGTTAGWHTIVKDGVTMKFYGTVSNYIDTNNNKEYHEFRIHKNQSIQFTSAAGNIRMIEFTCDEVNNVSSYGIAGFGNESGLTVSEDGYEGVWEGKSRDITFDTDVHQVRASQIVVTLDDELPSIVVADPVFSPENNTKFVNTLDVTITCETEGAAIYYSINDGDYQLYENTPITLNETSTVKAYAELEGEQSAEVTAKYTKLVEVTTIAEANALGNKTDFIFYGNVVTVYQNGSNLWVKDDSGYGLIFGSQVPKNIPDGSTLKEEWDAQYYYFRGAIHEYQYPNNVVVDEEEPLVEIVPNEYTSDQITTEKINERVILKGLTLLAGPDKYLYNSTDSLTIYNQFGITLPTELEGKTYDVEGMVSYYDGKVQIMPITITEVQATEFIRGDVDNNGEVKIGDVTALINYLLSGDASEINLQAADCDQNGEIKIGDVTALINFLLSGAWE